MIDNNTSYARYEINGASGGTGTSASYYGYIYQNQATPTNITDSSTVFSIKKQYYIGNVQYSAWSNNTVAAYESDWTNRVSYFATPSGTTSITATYSFNGSQNIINFSWTSVTGVSRYLININGGPNNSAITYFPDALSSAILNPEHRSTTLTLVNQVGCIIQNVATGSSYTIVVQPSNGYGTGSASTLSITI